VRQRLLDVLAAAALEGARRAESGASTRQIAAAVAPLLPAAEPGHPMMRSDGVII
jgi:hypothetical protein